MTPAVAVTSATRPSTPRICSVAGALEVVGEKWSLLVVRELFLGCRKFSDIAANTGAPRDILTARLRRLEDLGVITRRVYSERPLRHEYVLTDAGKALRPVIMTLKHWGDTYVMQQPMPPLQQHSCGEVFEPRIACAACGEIVTDPRSLVTATAGTPAVGPAPATSARPRRSRRSPTTG